MKKERKKKQQQKLQTPCIYKVGSYLETNFFAMQICTVSYQENRIFDSMIFQNKVQDIP